MAFVSLVRCDKCFTEFTVAPEGDCPVCVAKIKVEEMLENLNSQEKYDEISNFIGSNFSIEDLYNYHYTKKLNKSWGKFISF